MTTNIQETLEQLIDIEAEKRAKEKLVVVKHELEEIKEKVDTLASLLCDKEEEQCECDDSVQDDCELVDGDAECRQEVNTAPVA